MIYVDVEQFDPLWKNEKLEWIDAKITGAPDDVILFRERDRADRLTGKVIFMRIDRIDFDQQGQKDVTLRAIAPASFGYLRFEDDYGKCS